ncbi:DUF4892 domain-containing protein [Pseudomaricurvus alkylphenolicus]|jgi:hypothetical protein|uniref:DUF4892 domain-containing protein n=1 Tax=Pseudomaricurvus alkylphenolicus TaxID=1306991 RepID=UPI00142303ED|nr:DUF4892 domain-containing protein [Pseudomaricurvus alkylphenolicus]NIB41346.1 DUF4892 domain-containing protein [Pseudomaricurvus alkylphenolicus]
MAKLQNDPIFCSAIAGMGLLLVTWLLSPIAAALPLAPYPHAKVVFELNTTSTDDYRLTLGEMKKVNNQWRPEREQRLTGELQRKTLELEKGYDVGEVFDYFRQQLLQMGGRELFACQSRRCGSSNSWANIRFGIKQLYGLDQHQFYSAIEVGAAGDRSYVALYAVQRGNKRSYVQIDTISTAEQLAVSSSPEVIAQRLRDGRSFVLPGIAVDQRALAEAHLPALVAALRSDRGWNLALVAHDFEDGTLEQQQQRSLQLAKTVRQQLLDAGVAEGRVVARGLGSLVPGAKSRGQVSVEVVLVRLK